MTINKDMFTQKEIAEEVDKLIKFTLQMQIITRYTGGEKANIQKLSIWAYLTLKGSE
jgi:hypothetical protein